MKITDIKTRAITGKMKKIYFNNGMRITFDFGSKLRDGTYDGWGMDNNHGSGMRVIIYDEHINTITEKHMENNVSKKHT